MSSVILSSRGDLDGCHCFHHCGESPGWTYGLPNPGYVLILYENSAPSWELRPLYPEIEDENIVWISSIRHMLEDALVMIGIYVVRDRELRRKAEKIFGDLYKKIEIAGRKDIEELRKLSKKVLQRYNIGLVVVPLKDSTIMNQLDVLEEYGDLWVSVNPPKKVLGERDEWENSREYVEVFQKILETLREESKDKKRFEAHLEKLNSYRGRYKQMSDEEMFRILVQVVFFAGMNTKTVEKKMPTIMQYLGDFKKVAKYEEEDVRRMLNDRNMIRNRIKIEACIHNAKEFERIIQKYGSFANYLDSFNVSFDDYDGVKKKIRPALIRRFRGIGKVTAYHFLMELGFNVMKPDTTILRLFYRMGWLESLEPTEENIDRTIKICGEIAKENNV